MYLAVVLGSLFVVMGLGVAVLSSLGMNRENAAKLIIIAFGAVALVVDLLRRQDRRRS